VKWLRTSPADNSTIKTEEKEHRARKVEKSKAGPLEGRKGDPVPEKRGSGERKKVYGISQRHDQKKEPGEEGVNIQGGVVR